MSDDLTPEAVERLAADLDLARKVMFDMGTFETGQVICKEAAATLRALSARLAALERAAVDAQSDAEQWARKCAMADDRAEAAEARLRAAEQLAADLRAAVTTYHLALDRRQNGNSAGYRLQDEIQRILDMPWKQGAALAKLNGGA